MKDFLSKNDRLIQWLSGLGIPLALVVSSWLISTSVENTKVDSEYVKLAVGILTSDIKDGLEDQDDIVMRKWAVRVLDLKSPVKFTSEEKESLSRTGFNENYLGLQRGVVDIYAEIMSHLQAKTRETKQEK